MIGVEIALLPSDLFRTRRIHKSSSPDSCIPLLGEQSAKPTPRVVQAAHDGALRDPQRLRDLGIAEPVDLAKQQRLPRVVGQLFDRAPDGLAELRALQIAGGPTRLLTGGIDRIESGSDRCLERVRLVPFHHPARRLAAFGVDAEIHHHPVEPRVETRTTFEPVERAISLEKCVLNDISCLLLVAHHPECQPKGAVLVSLHKHPKGVVIPLDGPRHGFEVARVRFGTLTPL